MAAWVSAEVVQGWIGADNISLDQAATLAQAATDALKSYLERDLAVGTYTEWYDANGTNYILLNQKPIRSIASLTYNGTAVTAANPSVSQPQVRGYRVDPFVTRKLIFVGYGALPRAEMAIQVTYTAGYDIEPAGTSPWSMPGHVVQALNLTCAAMFNSQAADPNLTGENIPGAFSGSFVQSGVGAIPPGALNLIQNERRGAP